jgi:hypothetical protein
MVIRAIGPAICRGEPAGRRWQYRRRGRRTFCAGRLHAVDDRRYPCRKRHTLRQAQFRCLTRHRCNRFRGPATSNDACSSLGSSEDGSRIHRLCQSKCRQDQHGFGRHWFSAPHGWRAIQADGRHRLAVVPYRGTGAAYADLLGGRVQVAFFGPVSAMEHVKSETLRALAVTASKRWGDLPDIPTVAEFLPGYEAYSWFGVAAPKNIPTEIVLKLNQEINAALADLKIKSRIAELGASTLPGSPADFGKLIADETEKWGKVVRAANIKPD